MANIIENVKEVRIRNASNGDYDLKFVTPSSDYRRLEEIALNSYPSDTATGNPIYFDDGADDIPVKELIVNLEPKQSGSGDPSPSNVRPITGYDGVTVTRTGKNLIDESGLPKTVSGSNYISFQLPSWAFERGRSEDVTLSLKGGLGEGKTRFALYINDTVNNQALYISNSQYLTTANNFTLKGTIMVSGDRIDSTKPLTIRAYAQPYDGSSTSTISGLMLAFGDTDYEPYQGQEYSITFPSSVGTLYGGKLNVTTALLTIDRYNLWLDPTKIPDNYIHFDVLTNNARIGNLILTSHFGLTSAYNAKYSSEATFRNGALSNWSVEKNKGYSSDTSGFYFSGTDRFYLFCPKSIFATQDASGFKQYLTDNPLYICYELATPITYQLTPTEVSTLLGYNVIQSDGDMDLEYRADINKIIERLTNA